MRLFLFFCVLWYVCIYVKICSAYVPPCLLKRYKFLKYLFFLFTLDSFHRKFDVNIFNFFLLVLHCFSHALSSFFLLCVVCCLFFFCLFVVCFVFLMRLFCLFFFSSSDTKMISTHHVPPPHHTLSCNLCAAARLPCRSNSWPFVVVVLLL